LAIALERSGVVRVGASRSPRLVCEVFADIEWHVASDVGAARALISGRRLDGLVLDI
jgi:hypothetical protein